MSSPETVVRSIDPVPVFAALGDPTRLALVERLGAGEPLSITQLSDGLGRAARSLASFDRTAVAMTATPAKTPCVRMGVVYRAKGMPRGRKPRTQGGGSKGEGEKKGPSPLHQIVVAVVIALAAGGSAPWWWDGVRALFSRDSPTGEAVGVAAAREIVAGTRLAVQAAADDDAPTALGPLRDLASRLSEAGFPRAGDHAARLVESGARAVAAASPCDAATLAPSLDANLARLEDALALAGGDVEAPISPVVCRFVPAAVGFVSPPEKLRMLGHGFDGDLPLEVRIERDDGAPTTVGGGSWVASELVATVDLASAAGYRERPCRRIAVRDSAGRLLGAVACVDDCPPAQERAWRPEELEELDRREERCPRKVTGCQEDIEVGRRCDTGFVQGEITFEILEGNGRCDVAWRRPDDPGDCTAIAHLGADAMRSVRCTFVVRQRRPGYWIDPAVPTGWCAGNGF